MNAHIARAREESTQAGSGGNFGGNINQSFGRNRIVQGFDTHHVVPAAAFWVGQFPGGSRLSTRICQVVRPCHDAACSSVLRRQLLPRMQTQDGAAMRKNGHEKARLSGLGHLCRGNGVGLRASRRRQLQR